MSPWQFIFLLIALYIGYKLVFDLIIPIARATRQVRKQFRSMNDQMQQQAGRQTGNGWQSTQAQPQQQRPTQPAKPDAGDYIDFEEIK